MNWQGKKSFMSWFFPLFFQQARSYRVFAGMPELTRTNVARPSGQMLYK